METKLKQQFYQYLSDTFGEKFTELIDPPEGVLIGERVLYKLTGKNVAERKEMTQKDIDDFHQMAASIAEKIDGATVEIEPPITSGLSHPRTVDIIDWSDVAMAAPAKKYVVSDNLLPKDNFSIEWLFGLVLGYSYKQLVYIDFTHPKVKASFSARYDDEYDVTIGHNMYERLRQFNEEKAKMISEVESKPDILWVKLIQLNDQIFTQSKSFCHCRHY